MKDEKNRPRTIPLADVVLAELVEHVRVYGLGPDGLLFTNAVGAPLRRNRFTSAEVWPATAHPVGIPIGDGYHQLHHYFASLLISGGASITLVRLLGHASLQTTQLYAHLFPDSGDRARAAVDRVLGKSLPDVTNQSRQDAPR